jgi:hypothetical protein
MLVGFSIHTDKVIKSLPLHESFDRYQHQLIQNEIESFVLLLNNIIKLKEKGAIGIDEARVKVDIHKHTMLTRLLHNGKFKLTDSNSIIHCLFDMTRDKLYKELDWILF